MNRLKRVIGVSAVILIVSFLTQVAAFADNGANSQNNARHSRIVGLWDVSVTAKNCASGAVLFGFPALHMYQAGGTGQVVPGTNPASLSAHMMIWEWIGGNDYQMTAKFYRFDATGARIGSTVLNFEVSIDEDAVEYSGSGVAQTFDNSGNPGGAVCTSLAGTRFTGE